MVTRFNLKNLIHPMPVRQFREEFWAKKSFVGQLGEKRLRQVCAGLRFDEFKDVIADSGAKKTTLWFAVPGGSRETNVPAADALAYAEAGMTLLVQRFDQIGRAHV